MTNSVVGRSAKDLAKVDTTLSALSNLAYPVKQKPVARKPANRTSRFWFKVESVEEVVAQAKVDMAPREVEHVDAEVTKRLVSYKGELTPALKTNIEAVREFFLRELTPLTVATEGGILQAKDVVQRMLDTEVDSALIDRFRGMASRAAVLRLAIFITDYFKLPKEYINNLFSQPITQQDSELKQVLEALAEINKKQEDGSVSRSRMEKAVSKLENIVDHRSR
jgi:hypothetical protein